MTISPYMMGFTDGLPSELESLVDALSDLALDLRWTWSHAGDALWAFIEPQLWEQTENPFVILQNLTIQRLHELNGNPSFRERLQHLVAAVQDYRTQSTWFGEAEHDPALTGIAYFSMEFGLGEALPLYAGGLGVLAGDYLKASSDLGVPLVGVGLLYQEGYFRQVLDDSGWQQEIYSYNDSTSMPIRPTQARHGGWLQIPIELPGRTAYLRVWEARVGRVTLYLLDSNTPMNSPADQGITGKLYGGGQEMRLVQEIALGIGGWRLIESLGLDIAVCHLNEGHAAFVTLERARCYMERNGVDFHEAMWATRAGNVFTTHTPVAAGFDTFQPALLAKYGRQYADSFRVAPAELAALGRRNSQDSREPFNMAYLAARTCSTINGVSRLHGAVSRQIFEGLYPRWPQREVPVTHVTNGIHVPSWDSLWADKLWTQSCGKGLWLDSEQELCAAVSNLDDETLWNLCGRERSDFIHHARHRLARLLGQRGDDAETVAVAEEILDPNVLTLGFARRFAEYKRPNLLLHDPERLARLLTNPARPVQIVVAGKAHPADETGKRFIQEWAQFVGQPRVRRNAVFLEDYDIALAQEMVQGVDVWINNPRRPWEASGTSGMKVLVNGGLNLSELDGWWAEAYSPEVGWALGDGREHGEPGWDAQEAEQLYRLLEEQVVPMFYDRDAQGIPRAWLARMRQSMARLTPQFSTNRMVHEYVNRLYSPAAALLQQRTADQSRVARELHQWAQSLRRHWPGIHMGGVETRETPAGREFTVPVYLGDITPDHIQVQLYAEPAPDEAGCCEVMRRGEAIPGAINGYVYRGTVTAPRTALDYTARVVPHHPQARVPGELALITWQH
jgi:starch phosphorylase